MKYTIQEKKNHKSFLICWLFLILSGILLSSNILTDWVIGWIMLVVSWFKVAYTGYSHGWELKRISMIQEEEE